MRYILALIVIILPGLLHANCGQVDLIAELEDEARAELNTAVAAHPFAQGNVWRVEKDDAVVHIIGTFHLSDPRFDAMMASLAPTLAKADRIWLEANSEEMQALSRKMASDTELLFITEGPTLIDLLGEDHWALLTGAMRQRGIPGFMVSKMQPWYAMMTLSIPPCAMGAAIANEGLDARIDAFAVNAEIPTRSLENAEETLALLSDTPMDEQLDLLRATLLIDDQADAMYSTMVTAYFDGRHRELWEFSRLSSIAAAVEGGEDAEVAFTEIEESLLIQRNLNWMDVLLPVEPGYTIVAVGAAHLSGDQGLINLFQEAGFSVSAIDF